MRAYVCIHDYDAYLRAAVKAAMTKRCPGIRIERLVRRQILAVEARGAEELRCWVQELNAVCKPRCVHQVEGPEGGSCLP